MSSSREHFLECDKETIMPFIKPRIKFDRSLGYWICGGNGSFAIAAGCTMKEAFIWWKAQREGMHKS
jgi:hypothetical protein